ncbi:hypothetical protein DdX_13397 [Ditylenchus destructor]|uniref:Uncharacterized protein n=1 Tax=Ditylenchus destructor TaxID=166010 RepID=A0AAD4MWP5_9BILA|nr:hypothetical protein DdX_13397 [Ditylenchus destructor]
MRYSESSDENAHSDATTTDDESPKLLCEFLPKGTGKCFWKSDGSPTEFTQQFFRRMSLASTKSTETESPVADSSSEQPEVTYRSRSLVQFRKPVPFASVSKYKLPVYVANKIEKYNEYIDDYMPDANCNTIHIISDDDMISYKDLCTLKYFMSAYGNLKAKEKEEAADIRYLEQTAMVQPWHYKEEERIPKYETMHYEYPDYEVSDEDGYYLVRLI